jgi:Icc-related predicted phosphoesterase
LKLLLCSDLHCDVAAAKRLVALVASVDVFVCAGDFANVRRGISKTIDVLRAINCPAVLVAGNAETTDELTAACRGWISAHVLHGTAMTIDGVPFFGLGGAVPVTPFGSWSYDLTEDEAAALLTDCPPDCVLVTHSPPKGAVDRDSGGRSLGSTAVRDAIQRVRPRLVVCGHIHGSAGQEAMLGSTPVVNAGPAGEIREI